MATRAPEQDRAVALDTTARGHLTAGNAKAARQAAREGLEFAAKAVSSADPALGAQVDAWLAGVLTAIAAGLPRFRPTGYRPGPPGKEHLTGIYETAYTETTRR